MALAPGRPEIQLALGDYYTRVVRADYEPRRSRRTRLGLQTAPDNAELLSAAGRLEQSLGRWEAAAGQLEQAQALDPRSVLDARRRALALLWLRRYPEAHRRESIAGWQLAPTNLLLLENKAMVRLAQGDLAGARAVIRSGPPGGRADGARREPSATTGISSGCSTTTSSSCCSGCPPAAFDDDRGALGHRARPDLLPSGRPRRARAYADSALAGFEEQIKATPDDPQQHGLSGLTLAYLGRKAEAIREGERAASS